MIPELVKNLVPSPFRAARTKVLAALAAVLACFVITVGGCSPGGDHSGPGGRAQQRALSPEQELELGRQANEQVLSKARQQGTLLPSTSEEVQRVRRVGARIQEVIKVEPLMREINLDVDKYRWEWTYNVIESNQVNAFCLPAGYVVVFTGLLQLATTDDELATVMGHEIAHALAHHASERLAREGVLDKAKEMAGRILGQKVVALLGGAAGKLYSLSFSRRQESEADHIGLFLMTFAGYDPDQAITFWQKMEEQSARTGRPPEILSTHPSDAHRIQQLRRWIPHAKAAFQAWGPSTVGRG
jgi:predicted Zn-dependent protease